MPSTPHTYLAIDLKSYYASVECADRHLDPLTTNLVVADVTRTEKTICLAVSPSLKSLGISGRARLFEVSQAIAQANAARLQRAPGRHFCGESFHMEQLQSDPTLAIAYLIAPPRMARYLDVSAQIYAIYLQWIAPEDIFTYSIDEVFIDVTPYLKTYHMSAHQLALTLVRAVLAQTGITATCGIGSNLYLAKVAMDIVAKHMPADQDGVRIAELEEHSYREQLWGHRPITDFWRIGQATAKKLAKRCIFTMEDLAKVSLSDQAWLYKTFGIDAEILIDHAWGVEPCQMADLQSYQPASHSLCEGQVLQRPYSYAQGRIIVQEMADHLAWQLRGKKMASDLLTLSISYDRENIDQGRYHGAAYMDRYGRRIPLPARGSTRLTTATNLNSLVQHAALQLFDQLANRQLTIRKLNISAEHLTADSGMVQLNLYMDGRKLMQEHQLQESILKIHARFGNNAILKGSSYLPCATARQRNGTIGGHSA